MAWTREELESHHREMVELLGGFEYFIKRVGVRGFIDLVRTGAYVAPLLPEERVLLLRRLLEEVTENGKTA
jgi:hypothetical protein